MIRGESGYYRFFVYLNKRNLSQSKVRSIDGFIVKILFTLKLGLCGVSVRAFNRV